MRYYILLIYSLIFINIANADVFNKNFSDSTLRIDYIFGGGKGGNHIFLQQQTKQKGWAGRRSHLKETPVKGNGNIIVKNPNTGDTLYNNCFSTLFQEWLSTPEASVTSQSFENSFLIPLPKNDVDITISLRDNRGKEITTFTHRYKKDDELVRNVGERINPYVYIHKAKEKNAINLAILAEGYTNEEMDSFINSAKEISNEILSYQPFSANKDKFNIVAVMTPSEESGVSIPLKDEWKDTRYDSHFSTFHSARYLTAPRVWKIHKDLEGIPYEHILILVNTEEYGGGGIFNSYQIASSKNEFTLPVTVHEFGHSFTGLADEYDYGDDEMYPSDIEPWEPNITTLVDFNSKWQHRIKDSTPVPTPYDKKTLEQLRSLQSDEMLIGVYEGAGYKKKGVYRPEETCRMRDNYYPEFCEICKEAIAKTISFYTK